MKQICVFCGSRSGALPQYRDAAVELGELLARRKIALVYGGGNVGMMGAVADAALANGGRVIGIVPKALLGKEGPHSGLTELHVVESMFERKSMMIRLSDAFIGLPGGIGTLDELFEIWTLSRLEMHIKPYGILNVAGFYDPLLACVDHMVAQRFLDHDERLPLVVDTRADSLLARLDGQQEWSAPK
ncbi:MAG: TIGR00730 family Rossman fold protein [Betaproteobacteria bacterium]|nr:TIGR00730 family Rossman fold protein [Betaproteobacteria bacterium]